MMKHPGMRGLVGLLVFLATGPGSNAPGQPISSAWLAAFKAPPLADRPLQIVHGIDIGQPTPDALDQMVPEIGRAHV